MTLHEFNQALSKGELTEELINQALLQGGRTEEEDEVTLEAAKYLLRNNYITIGAKMFERYPIGISYDGGEQLVAVNYNAWLMIKTAITEIKNNGERVYQLRWEHDCDAGVTETYSCRKDILQNEMKDSIIVNEVTDFRYKFGKEYIPDSKYKELYKMDLEEFKKEMEQLYKRVCIELPNRCSQEFAEFLIQQLENSIKGYWIIEK